MKQELIKNINPIIENFVDEILQSFDNIEKIRQDLNQKETLYQNLISEKEKELSEIRIKKSVDKESYDKKITELENAREDYIQKVKDYKLLKDEISLKNKQIEDDLAKTKIELIRAKEIRIQSEKIKDNADILKKDYELKLISLKSDFDKNSDDKKLIESEKSKLMSRENEIFVNEKKQNNRIEELNNQELKLRVERKEVDRLIKRYNLEQSLKEN